MSGISSAEHLLPVASTIGIFLVEALLKGTLVLVLGLAAGSLARRASASYRHIIYSFTITGILILPPLALLAPPCNIPLLQMSVLDSLLLPPAHIAAAPTLGSALSPAADAARSESVAGANVAARASFRPDRRTWTSPTIWLVGLWGAGALLMGLRLLSGHLRARRILSRSVPQATSRVTELIKDASQAVGLRRPVMLLVSDRLAVPIAWGWLRPRVALPAAASGWPAPTLKMVLLHELAHIRRGDALTSCVIQLASILHWYNPLFWLAARRLLSERERAADDLVLSSGVRATAYADCLIRIARTIQHRDGLRGFQVAMAGRKNLKERVMSIISGHESRQRPHPVRAMLLGTLVLVLLIPLASVRLHARPDETPAAAACSSAEGQAAEGTLDAFYRALVRGDEYEDIAARFLTADYFDDPWRTLEHYSPAKREHVFRNTIELYSKQLGVMPIRPGEEPRVRAHTEGPPVRFTVGSETDGCERREGALHLTRKINIEVEGPTGRRQVLARDLVFPIQLAKEDGRLKIRSFDGGFAVRRMDVHIPSGPIFIVAIDDEGPATPSGALLFKHFPRSVNPAALSLLPLPTARKQI